MAEETNAAQAVTAPDPTDLPAYKAARESGWSPSEILIPVEGETPPENSAENPKESTSESTGEKPVEIETELAPEAGETKESKETEKKVELKTEEHGPGWYRRELKRIRREMREEVEGIRAELAATKAEPAAALPVKETPQPPPAEPKEENFETHEEYLMALMKHEAEQIASVKIKEFQESVKKQMETEDLEIAARSAAAARTALDAQWAGQVNAGRDNYDDFDEVVFSSDVQVTPLMDRFVHESEAGGDVAYYLGTHQKEISRIAVLPQFQQVRELLKIESPFLGKSKVPESKPRATISPKPAPTTPIGGGNSMSAVHDLNDPEVARNYPLWKQLKREQQANRR